MRHPFFCLLLLLPTAATSANFQNLNFELATIPPTPVGEFGSLYADPAQAFPGWTVSGGYNLYNNLTLGTPALVLIGPNFPNGLNTMPLEGSYSVLLQYGPSSFSSAPVLSQTGLVPTDARYLTFLMSSTHNDARVSLDGQVLSLFDMGGGRMAGDVTTFAGREAKLEFSTTSYNGNWLYFDDVSFSPVPEPGTLHLLFFGTLFAPLIYLRFARRR